MQEKRTLSYFKEYTILKPDGSVRGVFSELERITAPKGCDAELYRALPKKPDSDGRWAVIDSNGDYVTPVKYRHIDCNITKAGDQFVIIVQCEDGRKNAITLDGREIFADNYSGIRVPFHVRERGICILCNDEYRYGLGNLATGEIILMPCYSDIEEIDNADIFLFRNEPYCRVEEWGLLSEDGKVLFGSRFINSAVIRDWTDFNVLCTASNQEKENYKYYIVDWSGKKVYETWSIKPFQKLRSASFGETKNAFIFYEDMGNWYRKGRAKLVVCSFSQDHEVSECSFRFGHYCTTGDIRYLAHRAAHKAGITEEIYSDPWF